MRNFILWRYEMKIDKNNVITSNEDENIANIFKAAILNSRNFEKKMARQGCTTGGGTNC